MSMKIDAPINRLLSRFFAPAKDGDRKVWFHSQNLNADSRGEPKGFPWEGRCWLHAFQKVVALSWHAPSKRFAFAIKADGEDGGTQFHVAIPPAAVWLTLPLPLQKLVQGSFWEEWNESTGGHPGSHQYTPFTIADLWFGEEGMLHWEFLKFDWGWSRRMPKWMDGSFRPIDFLFGSTKMTEKELSTQRVQIPMPEGSYPAKLVMTECTWQRPRWPLPTHHGLYAKVDMEIPIPHEGKGENSWDCGKDALHGQSSLAATPEEAIAKVVESVLRSRRRYDGNLNAVYPPPGQRPPPSQTEQLPPLEMSREPATGTEQSTSPTTTGTQST